MATNSAKNNESPQGKGNPSDGGQPKSQVKTGGETRTDLNYKAQLADDYTKDIDEPNDDLVNNPNRNPHKVNNQKPSYGGKS